MSLKLSKKNKHFYCFKLNDKAINELKENTINDITFDCICIKACINFTQIMDFKTTI